MSKIGRTVRFDSSEIKRIEEFLKANPFFDFSTLTRMSIQKFIENPQIQLKPIPVVSKKANTRSMES